jgi:ankyrin repeat protein
MFRCHDDFDLLHQGISDNHGWSLLARCAVYGDPQDALTLIRYGLDPMAQEPESRWTALHHVVGYGAVEAFTALLPIYQRLSPDLEMPDVSGWTLLHLAVENGNLQIIRELLANGADPQAQTLPSLQTELDTLKGISLKPLDIAKAYGDQRYLDLLDIMDDLGMLSDTEPSEAAWLDARMDH